jgi:signal recognition particle receptor subunit beta
MADFEQFFKVHAPPETYWLIVTGPGQSGKSEFIKTLCGSFTPTVLEGIGSGYWVGILPVEDSLELCFFEPPNARRFDSMWEVLTQQVLGCVVMVDSTDVSTFREAKSIVEVFRTYCSAPCVVAANKHDKDGAWSPDDLQTGLNLRNIRVIPCIATHLSSVKNVVLQLLELVKEECES